MNYVAHILGCVASYGVKADDALRAITERVADEFALLMSRETGMTPKYTASVKERVLQNVVSETCENVHEPRLCRGRTKDGACCKKRTFFEYCSAHRNQGIALDAKKRRVDVYMSKKKSTRTTIAPARFLFD